MGADGDGGSDRSTSRLLMSISEKLGSLTAKVDRLQAHTEANAALVHAARADMEKISQRLDRVEERRDDITGRITILESDAKSVSGFRLKLAGLWIGIPVVVAVVASAIAIIRSLVK